MRRANVLFVCGSLNQTTQMHQIAEHLDDASCFFTPFFTDGALETARRLGLREYTILGRRHFLRCLSYLEEHSLPVDMKGAGREYDLVVTCSDLIVPRNILGKKIILVQEGMTDPETLAFRMVRALPFLPRWMASTAANGLSGSFEFFCVASPGYRDLFLEKGVPAERIVITGIPNFDNCARFLRNDFPFRHYVLVCTSDLRETYHREDRREFIRKALRIAGGRELVFKLHPNEQFDRACREIREEAPSACVFTSGVTEHMIANCDVLITRWSSTVFIGLALGKECYSDFPMEELRVLVPLQNGCAAENIADVCREVLFKSSRGGNLRPYRKRRAVRTAYKALRAATPAGT